MYLSILDKKRINLLKKLEFLEKYGFYLAGGTALALQIGHRISVDFDFYNKNKFDNKNLYELLKKEFSRIILLEKAEGTLIVKINNIAVSFFYYPYPLVASFIKETGFPPLASKKDIAAMKIVAISDRGARRDFIDIYFLLKEFSLAEIFKFVKKKYSDFNIYVGLRSLTYFAEAEGKQTRNLILSQPVSWSKVKRFLIEEVKKYQKQCLK